MKLKSQSAGRYFPERRRSFSVLGFLVFSFEEIEREEREGLHGLVSGALLFLQRTRSLAGL